MSAHTEQKAIGYLTMGHVTVIEHSVKKAKAEIQVTGSADEPYTVRYAGGVWFCDCPGGKHGKDCAHRDAAMLISSLRTELGSISSEHDEEIDEILGTDEAEGNPTVDDVMPPTKPELPEGKGELKNDEVLDFDELFFYSNKD